MHLAIVSPYPPSITGIGQYGYHVSRALAQSGAFNRITVLTGHPPPRSAASGFDVPAGISVERAWQPGHAAAGANVVARLCQLQPDLVWFNLGATAFGHSGLANLSGLLSPAVMRRLGLPGVLTMHEMLELADLRLLRAPGGPLSKWGARWVTWALTQSDVVCVTLKHYAEWLAARHPTRCFIHIPIGLYDQPQTPPEPAAPELLLFTTLAPFKGLELLLNAFRLLQTRIPGARLTIAGAEHPRFPGYASQVRRRCHDLASVRWLGYVPEPDVREVFRHCQVVVLPYTAATGSSSVLYQAVMQGRPVVVSSLPELCSAVEETGLRVEFFASGDVAQLADSVERLLRSPERRARQVQWNSQAIAHLGHAETCRAYLRAFDLALTIHSTPARIGLLQDAPTESIG